MDIAKDRLFKCSTVTLKVSKCDTSNTDSH